MTSLIPLKNKLDISWAYNSGVFLPGNSHVQGKFSIYFSNQIDNITEISYGLKGEYILNYNQLQLRRGPKNIFKTTEKDVFFDEEHKVELDSTSFAKHTQILQDFELSFPVEDVYLPSSCAFHGDYMNHDSYLSVSYSIYVKVKYVGGISKKEKLEVFSYPVTYQSSAMYMSDGFMKYSDIGVFPIENVDKTSFSNSTRNFLNKSNKRFLDGMGLGIYIDLSAPLYIDMNAPFLNQFFLNFSTKANIAELPVSNSILTVKYLDVYIKYESVFIVNKKAEKFSKKEKLLHLDFTNSSIDLKAGKKDERTDKFTQIYRLMEYPDSSILSLIGLNSCLTNCEILNNQFKNTSYLDFNFVMCDNNGTEQTFKFKTECSPTVIRDETKHHQSLGNH